MTFQLSEEERSELRDAARRLLVDRSTSLHVRQLLDDEAGYDTALWSSIAELGWPAIPIPEDLGGMGASYTDLAVILHELGRQLTPSPLISNTIAARALQAGANTALADELVPGLAAGETVLGVALSSLGGSYDSSQLSVRSRTTSPGVVLHGTARFVPDGHVADALVVAAAHDDGGVTLTVVDTSAPGVAITAEDTFDRTRRLASVALDNVEVAGDRLLGDPGSMADTYEQTVGLGAIAAVLDAVGAAERILEVSTEYAKGRMQFDRPIGSFQAVKHHLANMFTDVEASRAAAAFAVDTLDAGSDIRHAAAVAKSFAGPACVRVASLAVQVHGGIGFTWEHDAHLFLKRVSLDEALFGTPKWHRQYLATALLEERLEV